MVKRIVRVPKHRRKGKRVRGYTRKKRRPYPKRPIRRTKLKARTVRRGRFGRFVEKK